MNGVIKNNDLIIKPISPREQPQEGPLNEETLTVNKKPNRFFRDLINKNRANTLTLKEFNGFLCNSAVKRKIKVNLIFAKKVRNLNKQIIAEAANTIAALDQELFLNIQESELLSPWDYNKSPNLQANSDQYNNLANSVCRDILQAPLMEERILIAERWIWIASYLFEELKDYSGSMAILVAFSRVEISRLTKTLAGLSKDCQEVYDKLSETLLDSNALKPVLNAQEAVIPALPLIQRDMTFIHDGNLAVYSLDDSQDKSAEISLRTGGGRKLMLAFNKLQRERRNFFIPDERNSELDGLLRAQLQSSSLAYNSKQAYDLSQQLESPKTTLKTIKSISFGKVVKSSKSSKPCMREVILEELMHDLNSIFAKGAADYLQAKGQSCFKVDGDYLIDWQKENQQLELLNREIASYIEAIEGYLTNQKNNSSIRQARALIAHLQAIDFKQSKMKNLEGTLSTILYKLNVEFGILEKLKTNPADLRLREIEDELNKISQLQENCQFSPQFLDSLTLFKTRIKAVKPFASDIEESSITPITDWRKREIQLQGSPRYQYSLLFNQRRQDTQKEKDSLSKTVVTFF